MRVGYDEEHDRARFTFVEGRQSYDGGYTHAWHVSSDDNDPPQEPGVFVQIGFEAPCDLLWLSIEPASRALPRKLLDEADRR